MKIESGMQCVIVGSRPYFEQGIGAIVRVKDKAYCGCGCGTEGWTFTEANRPIPLAVWVNAFTGRLVDSILGTHSWEIHDPVGGSPGPTVIEAKYLVPIPGDHLDEEDKQCAPADLIPA